MKTRILIFFIFSLAVSPLWAAGPSVTEDPLEETTPVPTPGAKVSPAGKTPEKTPGVRADDSSQMTLTLSVGPFLGVPASDKTSKEYNIGGGLEVYVASELVKNLQIGLDIGISDYTVNEGYVAHIFQKTYGIPLPPGVNISGDFTCAPVMILGKYYLGDGPVRPYLMLGAGFEINSARITITNGSQNASVSTGENCILLSDGLGLALKNKAGLEFFLQARVDMEFTSQNNSDVISITENNVNEATENGNLSDDSLTIFIPIEMGLRFL